MRLASVVRADIVTGIALALGLQLVASPESLCAEERFSLDGVDVYRATPGSRTDYLRAWDTTVRSPGVQHSLLEPGKRLPEQDSSLWLTHPVGRGVGIDAGVYGYTPDPLLETGHREYFLGLSYKAFDGGVWYTNEGLLDEPVTRFEAGWTQGFDADLSLSARIGRTGYGTDPDLPDSTNFSLGAHKKMGNLGFGLRLIDQGLVNRTRGDRLHFSGTVRADFD